MNEVEKIETEKYMSIISRINIEHLEICDCMKKEIDVVFRRIDAEYKQEVIDQKLSLNQNEERHRTLMAYDAAVRVVAVTSMRQGLICSKERELVEIELQYFAEKYNLNDVRVFIIIKSLLEMGLSAFRLANHSREKGIMQEVTDREGNVTYKLNPAEEAKLAYNKARIDAIKELNNIIEGQKHIHATIDLNKVLDAKDIFGEIDNEKLVDL